MAEIDHKISKKKDIAYFRYVDDILILTHKNKQSYYEKYIEKELKKIKLSINTSKTHSGCLYNSQFHYLGYKFSKNNNITVRQSSIDKFIRRIIAEFTKYKYSNQSIRAQKALISHVNLRVTGAISENKKYGWIAYFSEINHFQLLYSIDDTIIKLSKRYNIDDNITKKFKRIVRAYHETKHSPENGYLLNFNHYDKSNASSKKKLLVDFGYDDSELDTDDKINNNYEDFKKKGLAKLEKDVGNWS